MKVSEGLVICLAALLLAACTASGERRVGMVPPYATVDRITDEAIRSDFESIEALQSRLAMLNRNGAVPTSNYYWSKAQCWLDMARSNYHENDRSDIVEKTLEQSVGLIRALESRARPADDTPLVSGSVRLRDDLWEKAVGFKRHSQFACVAAQVACFEVQLVWMGHEYQEGGWRHANPYIGIAEHMGTRIERELAACKP